MKIAFISWDGPAQNYMESLFLPIFERVQSEDISFSILQFTWGPSEIRESIAQAAELMGITYEAKHVLRKPLSLATAAMLVKGAADIVAHARRYKVDVLMPRSLIPAGMALLAKKMLPSLKIFFDADGLMADERIDFGNWNSDGVQYRLFRHIETSMVQQADGIMTRTEQAKTILLHRAGPKTSPQKFHVIPNGKDERLFAPGNPKERLRIREEIGLNENTPLIAYVGSLGPKYHPEKLFLFFEHVYARNPESRMLMLTGNEDIARKLLDDFTFPRHAITLKRVLPNEVPLYLSTADLGLAFISRSFSMQAVSPIKVAEYLLCGVPVLSTRGVGDVDKQLGEGVGMVVDELNSESLEPLAEKFLNEILPQRQTFREACRKRGLEHFALDQCAAKLHHALLTISS